MPEGNELLDRPVGVSAANSQATVLLVKAIESGKLSRKDKYWITKKLQEVMSHETNLELIRAYQNDPDLFYKLSMLGGGFVAVLGAALTGMSGEVDNSKNVLPGGLVLGEMMMIPSGLTLAGFSAFMLAFPRVFGTDGIQMKVSGGGWGFSGEAEVG